MYMYSCICDMSVCAYVCMIVHVCMYVGSHEISRAYASMHMYECIVPPIGCRKDLRTLSVIAIALHQIEANWFLAKVSDQQFLEMRPNWDCNLGDPKGESSINFQMTQR